MLLAFIMVPLVQKELDVFRETVWNTHTHRIRAQKDTVLPDGIPDHIHIQSNMTLKTVVSVIPLVYVKKKKKKKKKKKEKCLGGP